MKFEGVVFLSAEEVERAHAAGLAAEGGQDGILDRGLLESAVAAPQTTVFGRPAYPSLARMAAALSWALARNHAFIEGNKRTAAIAATVFLGANGFHVRLPKDPWGRIFNDVAEGGVTRDDLAALLAKVMGGDVDVE